MESILQDLRFGARILYRSPATTLLVILALALGIGANSAMFGVVDALLLRPLNYADPDRLVIVWDRDAQGEVRRVSAGNFIDIRAQSKSFSEIAAWVGGAYVLTGTDRPEQLTGAAVSANFFHTLGVKPQLGRTLLPGEDSISNPGMPPRVAIISDRLWRETLGSDPNILGRTIRLNSTPYAVVGVMPAGFLFLSRRHDVWVPLSLNPQNREFHYLITIARLQEPLQRASAELSTLARGLEEAYPKSSKGWTVQVENFQDWLINHTLRTRLMLLFGAVGLVLLIACTNVASLLLARSAGRTREIALRISLGATRGRLTRQLLTESVLLALTGGATGLGLGWLLIAAAPGIVPPSTIPVSAPIRLSGMVILFTLGISLLTGILFGLVPALAATRPDVQESLKDSSRGSTAGRGRRRFRQIMVTVEVALALMLVASAGLMIESLQKLSAVEVGFDVKNVLTLRLFLPLTKYSDPTHLLAFHREAMQRIAALPGVQSVSVASSLPLLKTILQVPFDLEDAPPRDQGERPGVNYTTIGPALPAVLGIPLKRGRAFTDADNETAPPVAIVNQAFVDRYFNRQNPVGRRIILNRPMLGKNTFEPDLRPEIVGVLGNVKFGDLTAEANPMIYVPHAQNVWATVTYFAVRTSPDPLTLAGPIRRELLRIDKDQPIDQVSTLEQTLNGYYAEPKFQTQLMGAFAALALLLAMVGIYGINAYAVAQRRHEIGLRMALGATPGAVLRDTIGQGMRLTAIGIVVGLIGAVSIGSLLKSVLVGVSATDPVVLGGVSVVLAIVAALACYVPARRATHIDPAIALREE
jgi:putative ABC transport system permease protein